MQLAPSGNNYSVMLSLHRIHYVTRELESLVCIIRLPVERIVVCNSSLVANLSKLSLTAGFEPIPRQLAVVQCVCSYARISVVTEKYSHSYNGLAVVGNKHWTAVDIISVSFKAITY